MSKAKIVAAVDIGSSKITTLVAQIATNEVTYETSINIVGVASSPSRGVKKGQIVDIEESVEATIASVEAAERMAGYNLDRAYVSVGGAHISSLNSKGVVAVVDPQREIVAEDVVRVTEAARAISHPASREIIHVIPREYIVDGEPGVRDPVGMTGVRLEVDTHIVTASAAALKNLGKTVNEVGIQVEEMVFAGLASSYATLTPTEKELGCVLIDIGAGTTSVAAFVDGGLAYSSALPVGARNVTNDLAIGLRVSIETAENIKINLSSKSSQDKKGKEVVEVSETGSEEAKKVSKRTLTEGIIRPRLNEIFNMIKLDLEKAKLLNKIPSGAVITGGGALTVGIEDAARRTLALPIRVASPEGVTGLIDDIMTPEFATAIGLILYGTETGENFTSSGPRISDRMKMPKAPQLFSKLTETIKNLLP